MLLIVDFVMNNLLTDSSTPRRALLLRIVTYGESIKSTCSEIKLGIRFHFNGVQMTTCFTYHRVRTPYVRLRRTSLQRSVPMKYNRNRVYFADRAGEAITN